MTPEEDAIISAIGELDEPPPECAEPDHRWTAWEFGKYLPREERWCLNCGVMEMQEIRGGAS